MPTLLRWTGIGSMGSFLSKEARGVPSECTSTLGPLKPRFLSSLYHKNMSARTLVTFEQFEQFPDDGMKHELLKGEHIVVPPAKFRHSNIQHKLHDLLRPYV